MVYRDSKSNLRWVASHILACGAALALLTGDAAAQAAEPAASAPAATKSEPASATKAAPAPAKKASPAKPKPAAASAEAPKAEPVAKQVEPPPPKEFRGLDQDVQDLKKEVLDLNRELFTLEEELLFPANTQVAVFLSMDVGAFFALDTLTVKVDDKEVANYLYTEREAEALLRGGVQRVYLGNLKVGNHELAAFFTGRGPNTRDYKRAASLTFEKGVGAKYVELRISDKQVREQPEFMVKEWE